MKQNSLSKFNYLVISGIFLTGSSFITGCSPEINCRGYERELRDFKKIIPGTSTKESVEEQFGSPSTVSAFKPETWYYVSKTTSTTSFLRPKVLEQTTYAIVFNENNQVTHIFERSGDDMREINPVKRETPTVGHDTGLLKEVFSNFGKISAKGSGRTR